jgi:hypothetical protein
MKKILPYFSLLILVFCTKKQSEPELVDLVDFVDYKKADTSKVRDYIAIFDDKTEAKSKLSKKELKIVDNLLINAVNIYNDSLKIKLNSWNKKDKTYHWDYEKEKLNLRYYVRQYSISTNENGDKVVHILCLCSYDSEMWRNQRISVNDGGSCYLNAEINITKNKVEYFGTHGLA